MIYKQDDQELLEMELDNLELMLAYAVHNDFGIDDVNRLIDSIRRHKYMLERCQRSVA